MAVFANWLNFMKHFKLEFEIRRIVFGLLSILKTPGASIPPVVQQQLPQITKQLGDLARQIHSERIKTLEDNEKYIKKGFESSDEEGDDDFAEDDEEGELQEMNKMKAKIKKAMADSDDDDSYDPDYEETAGEFSLYDSPLEDTDELIQIKVTLDQIF